jgi:hypothetical protein
MMRGQLGGLLPRQSGRRHTARRQGDPRRTDRRAVALRYAAWDWPVGPDPTVPATTDPEKVFAAWTRLPDAPILAECGSAFDVVVADGALVRHALARLDRLGVAVGPVVACPGASRHVAPSGGLTAPTGVGKLPGTGMLAVLVRAGSAASIDALLDRRPPGVSSPQVIGRGARFELPASLDADPRPASGSFSERSWSRPPTGARPALPAAHVILGALALVPYRTFAGVSARP